MINFRSSNISVESIGSDGSFTPAPGSPVENRGGPNFNRHYPERKVRLRLKREQQHRLGLQAAFRRHVNACSKFTICNWKRPFRASSGFNRQIPLRRELRWQQRFRIQYQLKWITCVPTGFPLPRGQPAAGRTGDASIKRRHRRECRERAGTQSR